MKYGIQGGKGSFNEEAIRYYFERNNLKDQEIVYLYRSEAVLQAIESKQIDRGLFAIWNAIGGLVDESLEAMSAHNFRLIERFAIKISHCLMKRKDVSFSDIHTVMAHPQVFAQCRTNLQQKYPQLKQVVGEGDLIDHAKVAEALAAGRLDQNIAVMGSKVLAEINDLDIVERDLQDASENYTTFLLVESR